VVKLIQFPKFPAVEVRKVNGRPDEARPRSGSDRRPGASSLKSPKVKRRDGRDCDLRVSSTSPAGTQTP
jgi:hypothetical protein